MSTNDLSRDSLIHCMSNAPIILTAPCFKGVPVIVEGGACEPSWAPQYYRAAWCAVAHAEEPLRGIVFLTSGGRTLWAKSHPSWGHAVRLELDFPRGGATNVQASIASWVWPEPSQTFAIGMGRDGTGPYEARLQVPVREYGWHHFCTIVGGGEAPDIAHDIYPRIGETGKLMHLLDVPGNSPVSVDILLLPRRQTRKRRNQIWGVKDRCRDEVAELLLEVFDSTRTGRWPVDPRRVQRGRTT